MDLSTAVSLIKKGVEHEGSAQVWLDLGAGDGLFTEALCVLLPPLSTIFAVDKSLFDYSKLQRKIKQEIFVQGVQADFTRNIPTHQKADGILMANAFHFVKDKSIFFNELKSHLKTSGKILVVEYDMDDANTYVPYPISFDALSEFCSGEGMTVVKIGEAPSVYQSSGMYAAFIN